MSHECKQEDRILELCETVGRIDERTEALDKRINGSIDNFLKHIERGHRWRTTIVLIAFTLIGQFVYGAYFMGGLKETVRNNTTVLTAYVNKFELMKEQQIKRGELNANLFTNRRRGTSITSADGFGRQTGRVKSS